MPSCYFSFQNFRLRLVRQRRVFSCFSEKIMLARNPYITRKCIIVIASSISQWNNILLSISYNIVIWFEIFSPLPAPEKVLVTCFNIFFIWILWSLHMSKFEIWWYGEYRIEFCDNRVVDKTEWKKNVYRTRDSEKVKPIGTIFFCHGLLKVHHDVFVRCLEWSYSTITKIVLCK